MTSKNFLFILVLALGAGNVLPAGSLNILPLLDSQMIDGVRVFKLVADESSMRFMEGTKTRTLGYNGDYLGPTIRARKGEELRIEVLNRLKDPTTVHWHGGIVPAEADGNVHQIIEAGGKWSAEFPIIQPAATLWYHPHFMGTTAEQVYEGLAGMFIIDDDEADSLSLPNQYGVDDIPLILQERRFNSRGQYTYRPSMPDVMHGYFGNTLLVNGGIEPTIESPRVPLRLRILNGSNSSLFQIIVRGLDGFYQIGTDGGLLEKPVQMEQLIFSPSERVEIVLDLAKAKGDSVVIDVRSNGGRTYKALEIKLNSNRSSFWSVPDTLAHIERIPESESARTRNFEMAVRMGGVMTINGRQMDMNVINEYVRLGDTEIWRIVNTPMMGLAHTFHVHAVQFLVLDVNGYPPPPSLSGWKDSILLAPGDTVRIIARYNEYPGLYMYHCHLLEHEDAGMMGQFKIL